MIGYERIVLFLGKEIHISCDGRFYNGKILEINQEKKFLILIDFKLGEVPILFEDILGIEPFIQRGVEE